MGMFDDLIPAAPVAAPVAPPSGAGMFDDLIPAQPIQSTPGGVPIGPNGVPRVSMTDAPAPQPPSRMHSLAVGAQGVGAGIRDIALMPFDLAAGATNLVAGGVNKVFGTSIPAATPASQLADRATAPFAIPESDMTSGERVGYNVGRFGTQGLGLGTMLAARAPAVAEAVMPSSTAAGHTLDAMARPYTAAPAKTIAGDGISGIGSGLGVSAADEFLPKEPATPLGEFVKGAANFLAPLLGGVAGTTAAGTAEGLGGMVRNMARKRTDSNIPVGDNGKTYSVSDSNRAATSLQSKTTGAPAAIAQDIRENATDLTQPRLPGETPVESYQLPTSGLLSRDAGLVNAEGAARVRNGPEFIQRDQNVKEAAGRRVESLRDPNADQMAVSRAAEAARESQMAPVEQRVQQFEALANRTDQMRQRQGAEFGAISNSEAKANASRRLDTTVVDQNYIPARAEKNRQFDEAPGRTQQLPADDVFAAIDRVRAGVTNLGPNNQMPGEFMQRLDALRPRIDPETGANVGGPGTAAGGDLADLRKYLNTAQETAQRSGNFDLADNIGHLRRSINQTIGDAPGYAEANANYGQFANRYRPERNDEGAKFTREIDRGGQQPDGTLNRGGTPPSETAGRFLASPEKIASLQRMLDGANNAGAGQAAVRDYMRSDFASSALNADGTLNPARAAAWGRNNADVLAQFPTLRTEFDTLAQSAQRGTQLSTDARAFLDQARRTAKATEAEIDRSAIGTLLREDPRDVAGKLLNGGYGAEKKLDEINTLVRNDADAQRGWKAAVAEVLTDKVASTRKIGETSEVQYQRLSKELKDNEALLAKTFSPEEMNTLRQGHKLLEYFKEAEKRASTGSNTAEKAASLIPAPVQLAVRALYGDLKGGGIVKRFKLLLEQLPSNKQSADEIVQMAWFNPDVAAYLLEKPIKNPNVPQYNVNLRRLLATDNTARESGK